MLFFSNFATKNNIKEISLARLFSPAAGMVFYLLFQFLVFPRQKLKQTLIFLARCAQKSESPKSKKIK